MFVNCPFDELYRPLQRALVFALLSCGLDPQLSESRDAGTARLAQIKELIRSCRYSVHDISRCEALAPGDLPRFNMPFELGLDLGCKEYGPAAVQTKAVLVLEAEQYRYQQILSDLAGSDIRAHDNDPEQVVLAVREWVEAATTLGPPPGSRIWADWNAFQDFFTEYGEQRGYLLRDREDMAIGEFIKFVREWQYMPPAV